MAWKPNRQNSKTSIKCDKSQNKCFNKLEILVPSLKTLWEPTPSYWACRGYGSTAFPRSGTQWPTITRSDWHRSPAAPQGIRKVEPQFLLVCVFSHAFPRDTSHTQPFLFTPSIQIYIWRVLNGAVKFGQGFAHLLCCNSPRHLYFSGIICQWPELVIEAFVTSWLRKDSSHHHYRAASRTGIKKNLLIQDPTKIHSFPTQLWSLLLLAPHCITRLAGVSRWLLLCKDLCRHVVKSSWFQTIYTVMIWPPCRLPKAEVIQLWTCYMAEVFCD